MLGEMDQFIRVYDRRPVEITQGGTNLFHAFAQWCIVRTLRPKFIVESGVFHGWGTWLLRQAAPNATIVIISPVCPDKMGGKHYLDPTATNLCGKRFVDFSKVCWDCLGLNKRDTLIYFDDHQSGYRRLLEAEQHGFQHVMYDDGYPWPGDNYALKQTCDRDGALLQINGDDAGSNRFTYADNFNQLRLTINSTHKQCMYDDMQRRLDVYREFPPLWDGDYRNKYIREMTTMREDGLLSGSEIVRFLHKFKRKRLNAREEAARYTFIPLVRINRRATPRAGCLDSFHLKPPYALPV
jgi:hypothetical protein